MNVKYKMDRRTKQGVFVLLMSIIFIALIAFTSERSQVIKSSGGVMDLTAWNFQKEGIVSLDGEWSFNWEDETRDYMVNVPSPWNYQSKDTGTFPVEGYGLYHLKVKLPNIRDTLALKLNYVSSAYQLFIDDRLVFSCGNAGGSKEHTIPKWQMKTVYFTPQSDIVDIKIMASNFHYGRGGLSMPVLLGKADDVNYDTSKHLLIEVFLFGALFILGILFISLYYFGSRSKHHLFMGIFSIIISIRPLLYGEVFLLTLFPDISWELFNKLFILNFGAVQFIVMFLHSLYPSEMRRGLVKASIILQNMVMAAGCILPSRWLLMAAGVMEGLIILNIFYMTYVLLKAARKRERWAFIMLVSMIFLAATAVLDILNNSHLIRLEYYYTPVGLLVFTMTEFVIIAVQSRESSAANERLMEEVSIRNYKIEVEKRQRQISQQLNRVACDITSTLDLNEVLDRMLNHLYDIIPFSAAYIMLKENGKLKIAASKTNGGSAWISEKYSNVVWSEGLEGPFFAKKAVVMETVNNGDVYTVQVLPLYYNTEPLGVFEVYRRKKEIEDINDMNIIEVFADQAAIALQNAKLYSTLKEYANTDSLTQAYTRRYFKELADTILNDLKPEGRTCSIAMLDVDHFKSVNDRYGHLTGDLVLKTIVQRCSASLPDNAILARYGGEEFIVFFPFSDRDRVFCIMEQCRDEIRSSPVEVKQNYINITVSIGLAFQDYPEETLEQLIRKADEALYGAKRNGRDCICPDKYQGFLD